MNTKLLFRRNYLWVALSLISLAILTVVNFLDESLTNNISAYVGLLFLILTLVPGHLAKIEPIKRRAPGLFLFMMRRRRDFGITAGILFLLHSVASLYYYTDSLFDFEFSTSEGVFYGTVALNIIIFMLLTSNLPLQKASKGQWKNLHLLIWFAVPLILLHALIAVDIFQNEFPYISVIAISILLLTFALETVWLIKMKNINGNNKKILGLLFAGFLTVGLVTGCSEENSENDADSDRADNEESVSDNSSNEENGEENEIVSESVGPGGTVFTLTDVQANNSKNSCFVALNGDVYDITNFISEHPGGAAIEDRCGQVLDDFASIHPGGDLTSGFLLGQLEEYKVGILE
jgi:DMSO/TMAO reductase YedYZ heme-binding membrane subunit/predicted heme/steroid binding protein